MKIPSIKFPMNLLVEPMAYTLAYICILRSNCYHCIFTHKLLIALDINPINPINMKRLGVDYISNASQLYTKVHKANIEVLEMNYPWSGMVGTIVIAIYVGHHLYMESSNIPHRSWVDVLQDEWRHPGYYAMSLGRRAGKVDKTCTSVASLSIH